MKERERVCVETLFASSRPRRVCLGRHCTIFFVLVANKSLVANKLFMANRHDLISFATSTASSSVL